MVGGGGRHATGRTLSQPRTRRPRRAPLARLGHRLDALRAMSLDPVKYLVAPKLAAMCVALPALTVIADGLITLGGWIGTTMFLGFNSRFYLEQIRTSLST